MFKQFIRYVSMSVLSMISVALFILVDTFFISLDMGPDGLTALNIAIPSLAMTNGLGLMLGVGGGAKLSTLRARKKEKEARQVFTVALIAAVVFSIILMTIGIFFATPFTRLLGGEGHILPMARAWIRTVFIMSPAVIFTHLMMGFLRNDESPRMAMAMGIVQTSTNILLDWIFIFPLGMGMFGAGLATMLAAAFACVSLAYYVRRRKPNLRYEKPVTPWKKLQQIALTGSPMLIGEFSVALVMIAFNLVLLDIEGTMGVAAFGIVINLGFVIFAIFNGVAQGMQPLVSRAYGEGDVAGQRQVFRYTLITMLALATVTYFIAWIFPNQLVGIFNSEGNILLGEMARVGLLQYFIGYFFVGINIAMITYLSITNAPKAGFVLSILRGGVLIIPLMIFKSHLFGVYGVWLSYPVSELIAVVIAFVLWWRSKASVP